MKPNDYSERAEIMNSMTPYLGAVALMAGLFAFPAAARAADVRVSVEPGSCLPGGTVTAWITVENAAGTTGADLSLRLPDFAVPGPAATPGLADGFLVASRGRPGRVDLAIASAEGLPPDQPVTFRIPLLVARAADVGTYPLTFERLQVFDSTPGPVVSQGTAGSLIVAPRSADADRDGLPDDWEMAFFGNTDATSETDFDKDGIADLGEYSAGTDPTRAESVFAIDHMTVTLGQGIVEMRWAGREDRVYQIEWSDDPVGPEMTWHPVYNPGINIDGSGAQWTDDGSRTYELPQSTTRRFYRLRTQAP